MTETTSQPKVSVCIPVYNGEQYLAQAIESVLKQNFRDFELIIVDDCSTDGSLKIIKDYQEKSEKIRVFQNKKNLGITRNWNRCIELARGDYILILHQDDELNNGTLEKEAQLLSQHPDVGVVFGNTEVIYLPGGRQVLYPGWEVSFSIKGTEFAKYLLTHLNVIYCPTVMMRRELFKKYGLFDERFQIYEDYEMWLRLALNNVNFIFLHLPLAKYRYHRTNASKRIIRKGLNIQEVKYILESFEPLIQSRYKETARKLIEQFKQTFAYLCLGYALNLIYNGYYQSAEAQLNSAIEFYPQYRKHLIFKMMKSLNALRLLGRIAVITIETITKTTGLRKLLEKQTYPASFELPHNITYL